MYDHIFPYIIGLLSYIRVIIQDIVRNHQHAAPARLCVSNIQHTTYNTYYCSMRHIWTPPSESDERAPAWHRLGPSVGYGKEAVGHTNARSPTAAAATPTCSTFSEFSEWQDRLPRPSPTRGPLPHRDHSTGLLWPYRRPPCGPPGRARTDCAHLQRSRTFDDPGYL